MSSAALNNAAKCCKADGASQLQMNTEPKDIVKATQDLLKAKKWDLLKWPSQSTDLLMTKLKPERATTSRD